MSATQTKKKMNHHVFNTSRGYVISFIHIHDFWFLSMFDFGPVWFDHCMHDYT